MNTVNIPERKIEQEIPSCIEEMNSRQYIRFVELLLEMESGSITYETFKMKLAVELVSLKMDISFYFRSKEERQIVFSNLVILGELAEDFFQEELREDKVVKVARLSFVRQLIPNLGSLYGPADALTDITFCEYRLAHDQFREYVSTKDPGHLDHLIAILYRRRKRFLIIRKFFPWYDGQIRKAMTAKTNPAFLERRIKLISKLPWHVRYAIFLWFAGCEEFLAKGRPTINGHDIDFSKLYEGDSKASQPADIGLIGILFSLAETKVFGNLDETDNQNLFDVMLRLYQVIMQLKETESKYGSHN